MNAILVILAFWAVLVAAIYFFAFWPGMQCNTNDSNIISKEENAPWFQKYPDLYLNRSSNTLILLHIIVTHGDRTNLKENQYPKDPYVNATYLPFGYGELTNFGKRRMYEIGRALRHEYADYLQDYDANKLEAISSELRQSRESLELLLTALYPPKDELVWMNEVNWQPIQFRAMMGKDNLLGNPYEHCVNWMKYYNESMTSFERVMDNYTDYFVKFTNLTGWPGDLLSVNRLYQSISANLNWGYVLDDSLKDLWPEPTTTLNRLFWKSFAATDRQKQAAVGMLIEKILEDSIKKMQDTSDKQLHIYGCSEFNLSAFLRLLGQEIYDNPSYGAHIIVELHKTSDGMYYLQFFYRSQFESPLTKLQIPDCSVSPDEKQTNCTFDNFLASRVKYFLQDNVC